MAKGRPLGARHRQWRANISDTSLMINPLPDFQSSGVKHISGISGGAAFFSHKTMDNRFQTPEE
jgi:hypothetical protein